MVPLQNVLDALPLIYNLCVGETESKVPLEHMPTVIIMIVGA
jgi:hypothetical protein